MKWVTFFLALFAACHAAYAPSRNEIRSIAETEAHRVRLETVMFPTRNEVSDIARLEADLACSSRDEIISIAKDACDCL
mgnify:CR=1 FL=1